MLVHQNPQEQSLKLRGLGPNPGVSNSGGLGWAQESAFLTLPKVMNSVYREHIMLMLMVSGAPFHTTRDDH